MLADDLFHEPTNRNFVPGVTALVGALTNVGTDDRRAFAAEQGHRFLADPRSRAGDDRDLALQPVCHPLPIAAAHRL